MDKRPEFNDELLSAYLDDQLSPAERADVEARLAHDPSARELVRELHAAAEAVRDLPRVAAPRDLKAAILRAAEQIAAFESDGRSPTIAPATGSALSIGRSRRGWFWAALAVAAALLIMFINRDDEPGRDVALQNRDGRDTALPNERSIAARSDDSGSIEASRPLGPAHSSKPTDESRLALQQNGSRGTAEVGPGGREVDSLDPLAASGTELRRQFADQVGQVVERVEADGVRLKEAGGTADTLATNGQLASNVRFYKQVEENATGNQNLSVVLSNAEAAFGAPVDVIQPDVPVYFVSVNVTADAVRNNTVLKSLGRNSIALVNEAEANLPGLAQPVSEADGATVEERPYDSRGRSQVTEPTAPAEQPINASGVIAVEALPEQVAAFLNDIASDRQNVTAVAVLAEANTAQAQTGQSPAALETAANYNRNADAAIQQVAGNWRFEPTGQAGEPIRLERFWSAPDVGAALAQDDFSAFGGANGQGVRQRYAAGPEASAGLAGAGGYGGGVGADPAAGRGGRGGFGYQESAQTEAAAQDATQADEKAQGAASDAPAAVPQSDADLYRGLGKGVSNTLNEEGAPPEPAAVVSFGLEGLSRGEGGIGEDVDKALMGRAWIVSPLQVRSAAVVDEARQLAQQQTQQHFDFAPAATQPESAPPAPADGEAQRLTDRQLRERLDAQEVEDVRLQSRDAEPKDRPVKAETLEQLGDRPDAERSATLQAGAVPPPGEPAAPARGLALGGASAAPQQQEALREPQAQLFSATAAAPALPRKPVRVVLFFNVLPAEQEPVAASPPQSGTQEPAGAGPTTD